MITTLDLFIDGFYYKKMSKRKLISILTIELGHTFGGCGHYLRRELYNDFQFAGYDKELEILYDYYMFLKTLPDEERTMPEGIYKGKKSSSVAYQKPSHFLTYIVYGMEIIVFRRLFTIEFDNAEGGKLKRWFDDIMQSLKPLTGNVQEDKQIISDYYLYFFQTDGSLYQLDKHYKSIMIDEYRFVSSMPNWSYSPNKDFKSSVAGQKFGI